MPINGWAIALQIVNFLVLVWILGHFLYTPVSRLIKVRQKQIDDAFARAAAKGQEADERRLQYDTLIEGIDVERQRALAGAKVEAEEGYRRLLDLARTQAEEIRAAARQESEKERDAIAAAASDWAIETAVSLATRLLEDSSPGTAVEVFLERILAELRTLPEDRRADLLASLVDGADIRVLTPRVLADSEQTRWRQRLQDELGVTVRASFGADPSLIGGAELRFPNAAVAHTWRDALQAARLLMIDCARSL